MLKHLLKNKEFKEIIKDGLKNDQILDIILFGSITKGKEKPKDVDLLVLYKDKVNHDYDYELRKKLEDKGFKAHVIGSSYFDIFQPSFLAREGILSEGFSFKTNDFLFSSFGFSSFVLFRYSLKDMNDSNRTRFYYSLYGRGKEKGILDIFKCYKFSDNTIISPIDNSENLKEFFEKKNITFDQISLLLPKRMSDKRFL